METFTFLVAAIAAFLGIWYVLVRKSRPEKFKNLKEIPGPNGLPLIGNIHQMSAVQTHQFCKWSEEYGDLYQLSFAGQPMVVVSNAKLAKEIFNHPATTGKPMLQALTLYKDQTNPALGIIGSEGDLWETHRRFLLRQLRDFGFGKSSMEQLIMIELNELLETLEMREGNSLTQLDMLFRLPVINSLWNILTSKRFNHDEPEFLPVATDGVKLFNDTVSGSGLLMFLPILRKIFPEMTGYTKIRQFLDQFIKMFEGVLAEHKDNYKDDNLNDFIDVYVAEMQKADPNSHFYGALAGKVAKQSVEQEIYRITTEKFYKIILEKQLVTTLQDVFFAGSDTTISTLSWTMLYLSKHQNIQKKLQNEIDEITQGNTRKTCLADRKSMPYAQALIDEVLRHSSVIADGVAHRFTTDAEFQGYYFPKDAWIQPNIYFMHHDPKIWGPDADEFRPERFLSTDNEGKSKFQKNENILAFQVGRRVCVGETLARDTLFLFITNIFQQFQVSFAADSDKNECPSEFESVPGFFRTPKPFSIVMQKRQAF